MNSTKNKIVSCSLPSVLILDADLCKQTNQKDYLNLTGTLDDNLHELLRNQMCLEIHNKLLFNSETYIP